MSDLADRIYALTLGQKLKAGKANVPVNDAAPDLAARMAATTPAETTVAPKIIPAETPTPAVTPLDVAADRQARAEAAAAALANPAGAMNDAVAVAPGITPKLIPVGTPSPAVTPRDVAADKLARIEAMEAMRGQLAEGAAPAITPAPAVTPPAAAAHAETPAPEEVPPIGAQAPAETGAVSSMMDLEQPDQRMAQDLQQQQQNQATLAVAEQIKKEPKIGEKLLKLAKMTGKGILELIQGFAAGYSGSNIPLESQIRREEKAAKDKLDAAKASEEAQRTFQTEMAKAEQDFNMRIAQLQDEWQNRRLAATTEAEKQAADEQRTFAAQEAQKDRDASMREAQLAAGARAAASGQDAQGDLQKIIANIVAQLKGQ